MGARARPSGGCGSDKAPQARGREQAWRFDGFLAACRAFVLTGTSFVIPWLQIAVCSMAQRRGVVSTSSALGRVGGAKALFFQVWPTEGEVVTPLRERQEPHGVLATLKREDLVRISKRLACILVPVLLLLGAGTIAYAADALPFTDIAGHWAQDAIVRVAARGITDN